MSFLKKVSDFFSIKSEKRLVLPNTKSHIDLVFVREIGLKFIERLYLRIGWAKFLEVIPFEDDLLNPPYIHCVSKHNVISTFKDVPIYVYRHSIKTPDNKCECKIEVVAIEISPFNFYYSLGATFTDGNNKQMAIAYAPITNCITAEVIDGVVCDNKITPKILELMDIAIDGIKEQKQFMCFAHGYRQKQNNGG